ncbi:MAG: 16S rRNA (guanine(527)-N(7))-methyltransferase RsmG [Boseongicola sp.]|nr:16S rRNA (guanine(527)-N(7))-methyltransferase RsmG [Boseongicola sp.]
MNDEKARFADSFNVSRETLNRLEIYADLLRKWNKRINLVAPGTIETLWSRHFMDSAQVLALSPSAAQRWTDLGSGGGFPGAIVALLANNLDLRVILIESDQRKAAFLRAVSRETGANFSVMAERAEAAVPTKADVVSARALAPLETLLGYVAHHIDNNGLALLPKGAKAASEVELARKTWSFTCESIPSMTDKDAAILKIGDIKRV